MLGLLTLLSKLDELHEKLEGLRLVFDPRELIHLDHLIEDQLDEMTFGLYVCVGLDDAAAPLIPLLRLAGQLPRLS